MATRALDDKFLKSLKTQDETLRFFDLAEPGLSIRVTKRGRKTWGFDFTHPETRKRASMSLGTYPALSLKEAREAALAAKNKIQKGKDPKQREPKGKTIAELIEERMRLKVRPAIDPKTGEVRSPGLRSHKAIEYRHTKYILPIVGHVPVKDFAISNLNEVIDPLIDQGHNRIAGMVFSDLQTLFRFAAKRGVLSSNPIAGAENLGSTGGKRNRFLSLTEIEWVWNTLPKLMPTSSVPTILRLCLAMGQRLGEVCGMRRSELDLDKRLWTIPGNRTKNGDNHVVPLSDLAFGIVSKLIEKLPAGVDPLFRGKDGNALHRMAVTRAVGRRQASTSKSADKRFAGEHWTPHDLRRTVATHMSLRTSGVSISEFHIALILNHRSTTKSSITQGVYIQNDYLPEMREALRAWGNFIDKITKGERPPIEPLPTDSEEVQEKKWKAIHAWSASLRKRKSSAKRRTNG